MRKSILGISIITILGFNLYTPETVNAVPPNITVGGEEISFVWTDENNNEDLIIYTDKHTYVDGFSEAEVYVAVVNTAQTQNIELSGWFSDNKKKIKDIYILEEQTVQIDTPNYEEVCDDINGSSTNCALEFTSTTTNQITQNIWTLLKKKDRTEAEKLKEKELVKDRKNDASFIAEKKTDLISLGKDEVAYFKVLIEYPKDTADNFFIEAIGDKGAYGWLDPWFDASWDYRVAVEINPSYVSGSSNLSSYPVYIDLSDFDSDFHTNVKSDGCDIRVVESDETTETAFELVSYDSGADTGELHFMADSVSYSATTTFYIYYGNSGASCYGVSDTYGRNNVWTGYHVVYHSETETDSTGNTTLSDVGSTVSGSVAGQIEAGTNYDGTNDYVISSSFALAYPYSLQVWADPDSSGSTGIYMARYRSPISTAMFQFFQAGSGVIARAFDSSGNYVGRSITSGAATGYNMFHATYESTVTSASHIDIYKNGVEADDADSSGGSFGTANESTAPVTFGIQESLTADFVGDLDEIRIATTQLTADWIASEYNNQSSPSTFYWVGAQETDGGGGDTGGSGYFFMY